MKLAIFDLDGVLADTTDIHTTALRSAVREVMGDEYAKLAWLDAKDGVRTHTKLQRLKEEFGADADQIDLIKKTETFRLLNKLERNDVAIEIMTSLKRKGMKLAIASNSRKEFVDIITNSIGVNHLLDWCIAGDQIKNPKPHPEIFVTVMERFNIPPSSTIIFEDSESGLTAARNSGATVRQIDPTRLIQFEDVHTLL